MEIFRISGTLFSSWKMLSTAAKPFWKFGENEKALPIDHDPTITVSETLINYN